MAFVKKTWVDRNVENPYGRTITDRNTGVVTEVDVDFDEGEVYTEGDKLNATNFNDLETRIANAFNSIPTSDVIDDSTVALDKTWSSSKINGLLILDVTNVGV